MKYVTNKETTARVVFDDKNSLKLGIATARKGFFKKDFPKRVGSEVPVGIIAQLDHVIFSRCYIAELQELWFKRLVEMISQN